MADRFSFGELQKIDDGPPLGGTAHIRNLEYPEAVHAAPVCKQQDVVMGRSGKEVLDEIPFLPVAPGDPAAATALASIGTQRRTLAVALAGKSNRHLLYGDEIFGLLLLGLLNDLGAPFISELLLRLAELFDDDIQDQLLAAEDPPVVLDILA